jgi:D-sedoheptulose 7-phosphate isomerase
MESSLSGYLAASARGAAALAEDEESMKVLSAMADAITTALRAGGKLLIAGNGGSAADAQHIAAEFVSRLHSDRAPLAALALAESGAILTACGNDYGFETVFARQVAALGRPGDVMLALSTSGQSRNIILAAQAASSCGMTVLGFSGAAGGAMAACCHQLFRAPAAAAQIVQQLHVMAAHAVLGQVERHLFPPQDGR